MASSNEQSAIKFPCDFTLKIIGKATASFEKTALGIVRKHYPSLNRQSYKKRLSRDGNYLALTVIIHINSKAALDALYRELSSSPAVIMAL